MEEISKTRMELAIRNLERRAALIKDAPCFKGIPATAFDKEHLVMLCKLFANEWHKTQKDYFELLSPLMPKDRLAVVISALQTKLKPFSWSVIWKKIKNWL